MRGKIALVNELFLRYLRPMKTASDIVETIGRPRIRGAFSVKDRVIQQYIATGKLPASWFDACEKMTRRKLPRDVFTFKGEPR
jgi:hypothetical protein